MYKAWVRERCEITPRRASNYVAVHARLAGRRDELVKSRVAPTVLFRLARASDETVEAVLAEYAAGQRLTVGEVNRMIAAEGEEPGEATDRHDVGGAKGLRKLAQARAAAEAQEFVAAADRRPQSERHPGSGHQDQRLPGQGAAAPAWADARAVPPRGKTGRVGRGAQPFRLRDVAAGVAPTKLPEGCQVCANARRLRRGKAGAGGLDLPQCPGFD